MKGRALKGLDLELYARVYSKPNVLALAVARALRLKMAGSIGRTKITHNGFGTYTAYYNGQPFAGYEPADKKVWIRSGSTKSEAVRHRLNYILREFGFQWSIGNDGGEWIIHQRSSILGSYTVRFSILNDGYGDNWITLNV